MPQRPANEQTEYKVLLRPTDAFGYQPFIDFYDELAKAGSIGTSVGRLREQMVAKGWRRPRGAELTLRVMRTDLVSMCKHGFVERIAG